MGLRLLEILHGDDIDLRKNGHLMFESAFITFRAMKILASERFIDVSRINIICDDVGCDNKITECDKIIDVHVGFDDRYFSMTDEEKVKYLIAILETGLLKVFEFKGWDKEIARSVIADIPVDARENVWYSKLRCSADCYRTKVKCIHSMYEAKIIIEVYKGRKLIRESLPFITYPEIFHLTYTMGRLEYNEEKRMFVLYSSIREKPIATVRVPEVL